MQKGGNGRAVRQKMDELQKARQEIDEVDKAMADLFCRRMKAAKSVAAYKGARGLPILDNAREAEILERRSLLLEDETLRSFYVSFLRDTMAVSRRYQRYLLSGIRVAYAGTEGAFAHLAVRKLFPAATAVGCADFASAYRAAENGDCDLALLPVENSFQGEVGAVTDLMFSGTLSLTGMTEMPITQDLLAKPGTCLAEIRTVISHPQALGQCAEYIRKHGLIAEEYANTALAARFVASSGDRSLAAIASAEAAEIFGLEVLEKNIHTKNTNSTRFAVFSRAAHRPADGERGIHSVLLFTVPNHAGSLAHAIEIIGRHGFNMRTLRSRPMKELFWQYYFYVEAEGNLYSPAGEALLADLSPCCDRLKIVGCYKKEEA